MSTDLTLLRDRAARALSGRTIVQAVKKIRAIVAPGEIPASETAAQAALHKLEHGETPEFEEIAALEMVIRLLRPVVFSRNGVLEDIPSPPESHLADEELNDRWSAFRGKAGRYVNSVGSILNREGRNVGTGFLVAEHLVATNRHVLASVSYGAERLKPGIARIVFKREDGVSDAPADIVGLVAVAAKHDALDMVLLTVAPQLRPPLLLSDKPAIENDRVVAIGYPAEDRENNPLFLDGVFRGHFNVRRASLGEVLNPVAAPRFSHDCSTAKGNSGSPIFDMTSGEVVGIHCSGLFMYRNEAIEAAALAQFVAATVG